MERRTWSVTLAPGSGTGRGTVTVKALNACPNSTSDVTTYTVEYGAPPIQDLFKIRGNYYDYSSLFPGGSFLVYPNEDITLSAHEVNSRGQAYSGNATWSWVEMPLTSTYRVSTTSPYSYMFRAPNQGRVTWQVAVTLRSACGQNSETSYVWFTTLDTSTGEEPFRRGNALAYPNPTDMELTVPLSADVQGHVRLFNSQGRQVRQAPVRGAAVVLNVRELPAGLYQLEVPGASGPTRQTIHVQH